MFHRFGNAVDQKGNALPGWQVECVLLADGTTVVPIYSDEDETPIVGTSGVADRAVADSAGNYDYFVLDGNYSERFYDENGVFQGIIRYVSMYGGATEEIQDAVQAAQDAQYLAEAAATATIYETWTSLAAVTGSADDTAIIFDQAGTHTDPVTSASVDNAGLYLWTTGWKRIADTQAVIAGGYRDEAATFAATAQEAASLAQSAAEFTASGEYIYATKADATADVANVPEGASVMVLEDESDSDNRNIYKKSGGVLVLVGPFGSFSGGSLSSKLTTAASASGGAGLNIQPGVAPSSPSNGDAWTTATALYTRIGGVTRAQATIDGTETLTNKTLTLGTNTLTGTKAQFNSAMTDADFATLDGTETLTNKTLNLSSNTLTTTLAQLNTAVSDADVVSLAGTETLTNKTLTAPTINNGTATGTTLTNAPAASTILDGGGTAQAIGYRDMPLTTSRTSYTLALTDRSSTVPITSGTLTIPANSSVAFPVGSVVVVWNNAATARTLAITTDTLRWAGTANTGSRSIAPYGYATLHKVASTTWTVSGHIS